MKKHTHYFLALTVAITVLCTTNAHAQSYLGDVKYNQTEGIGLSFGYTNQQYKITYGNQHFFSNGIWGDNKRLHGLDMGLIAQGTIDYGIGIYIGLDMELYFSSNTPSQTYGAGTIEEVFDSYTELTFEIPLHIQFKQPLSDIFAIGAHTGPGMTLSCMALFEDTRGYYSDYDAIGDGVNVFNLTWDFAVFMELENVRLDAMWSTGLINVTNGGWDADKVTRNKFSLGISILFGED